jgi:hypothetical protein
MALLNERRKKADLLARELQQCKGCWVVSPLPLDDNTRALRFQLLDENRDEVISELCASGWIPNMVSPFPRFTGTGLVAAHMFEVEIPKERQPVPQDSPKMVAAEPSERAKTPHEVEQVRKYLGW